MKLDLEVDTEKLSDDQLEKLRVFLISVGMWKDELGTQDLKIPTSWEQIEKLKKWPKGWWSRLRFPFPRRGANN